MILKFVNITLRADGEFLINCTLLNSEFVTTKLSLKIHSDRLERTQSASVMIMTMIICVITKTFTTTTTSWHIICACSTVRYAVYGKTMAVRGKIFECVLYFSRKKWTRMWFTFGFDYSSITFQPCFCVRSASILFRLHTTWPNFILL